MPTIRQDGRMQARLAYPSEYLVGQVREYLLKTSEQARRLGTCYSKSGPRRPQRLSSKCPGDTNCDSQIAERPDSTLPPTTRTTIQRRTQSVLPAAASRRETKLAAKTRYPRAKLGALLGCAPFGPCLDAAHSPTDDAVPQPAGRKLGALADSLCKLMQLCVRR